MTTSVAVANQKGGVGKTTTALNVAVALADMGHSVLLLDLDPQGNATSGLGEDPADGRSIYQVISSGVPLRETIISTAVERLSLVPSHIDLSAAELELVSMLAREYVLKKAVEQAALDVDYLVIDCPPSLGLLTLNALVATKYVLVPVQCEFFALAGLIKLVQTVERVKAALNPGLRIAGAVMTMFDARTNLSRDVVSEMRNGFPGHVFETVVPRSVRVAESPSHGLPISRYDPGGVAALAYAALAGELIQRLVERNDKA